MIDLSGLRVLVTRPLHLVHEFATDLRRKGGNPIIFPTIKIEFLVNQSDSEKLYNELKNYQALIFTSQNSVLALADVLKKMAAETKKLTIAAIGEATAQKLKKLGLTVNFIPRKNYTSEVFIEEFSSQINKNDRIAILKGEGGRSYLREKLSDKTFYVKEFSIYRRLSSQDESKWLEKLLKNRCVDVLIVLSQETLNNLVDGDFSLHKIALFKIPLLVPSERIKEYAQELGFLNIMVVDRISNQALLDRLTKWRNNI